MCLGGAVGAAADLLAALPDADVLAFYVWVPMLPSDDAKAAGDVSRRLAEPRARHYWDGDRLLSRRMAQALTIDTRRSAGAGDEPPFAWDIYLAYQRGNANIMAPDFWMHQLAVDHAPRFDATEWRLRITEMLNDGRL